MERIFPTEATSYVQSEFRARKKRNASYSIRAFARDLGLSPSHLSEFLSGKSRISHEKAPLLADKLKLSGAHREHWCDLLKAQSKYKREKDAASFRIQQRLEKTKGAISEKVFRTIADWHYFAILACLGGCHSLSIHEISQRLNITEAKVDTAIDTLVELKLLEPIDEGYLPTDDYSLAGNTIPSEAIRESHKQILDKATQALEDFDMTKRTSQSLFVTVPQKQTKAFHEALRNKVLETAAEFSKTGLNEEDMSVEAITLQVFPLEEVKK